MISPAPSLARLSCRRGRWRERFDGIEASGGKTIKARVLATAVSECEKTLVTSSAGQFHPIRCAEATHSLALGHAEADTLTRRR